MDGIVCLRRDYVAKVPYWFVCESRQSERMRKKPELFLLSDASDAKGNHAQSPAGICVRSAHVGNLGDHLARDVKV